MRLFRIVLFSFCFGLAVCAADLPKDPNVQVVKLDNGLTCWLRQHQTPPGRVTIWLHVDSGSLNENEDQRGLAHFLEHMAFNGTEHFPPGELIKYFESIGLRFGQHQNAFTSYDQTTYMLTLPNTEQETLEKGFTCIADYAYRMSLLPEEIKKERGVILEEMRARDGLNKRISEKIIPIYAPDSRIAKRLPIGLEEVIKNANRELLNSYYRKWYRPDLTTLIVVGDIAPDKLKPIIEKQFSAWERSGEPPQPHKPGISSSSTERSAIVTDPEWKEADVNIVTIIKRDRVFTTQAYRDGLVDDLGNWILTKRLNDLVDQGKAPFQQARASKGWFMNAALLSSVSATGKPENARAIIEFLGRELKRLRIHGALNRELEQAVKARTSALERAVETVSTREAGRLAGMLNSAAGAGRLPMSPKQELELARKLIPAITLQEINAAYIRNFPRDKRLVLSILPEAQADDLTEAKQLEILHAGEAGEVTKWQGTAAVDKLADRMPAPGTWQQQSKQDDLDVQSGVLSNGARVHIKPMDYKKDTITVRVSLFGGEIQESTANRGITQAAALAFKQTATEKFSSTALKDYLTGKKLGISGWADEDTLTLNISGAPKDIETGFQLLYLLLTQPKLEAAALENWRTQQALRYKGMQTVAEAKLFQEASRLLAPDDPRMHVLTPEMISKLTLEAGQKWLDELITHDMEVAVVGDIDPAKANELVLQYIGALPKRKPMTETLDELRRVQTAEGPVVARIDVNSIANRSAVFVGWRSPGWRQSRQKVLNIKLAGMILRKLVREEIREERGWTYSAAVFDRSSEVYTNASYFGAFFTADPDKAAPALEVAAKIIRDFAETGPTDEQLAVGKKQIANILDEQMKKPEFWIRKLATLHYHESDFDYLRNVGKIYNDMTGEEIQKTLSAFIKKPNLIQIIAARPKEQ